MRSCYQIYGHWIRDIELNLWFEFEIEIDRKTECIEVYYIYSWLVEAVSLVFGFVIFSFAPFILSSVEIKTDSISIFILLIILIWYQSNLSLSKFWPCFVTSSVIHRCSLSSIHLWCSCSFLNLFYTVNHASNVHLQTILVYFWFLNNCLVRTVLCNRTMKVTLLAKKKI